MAVVELLLPALPSHVRTARLVGVAAARRAGLADDLVDELRLAVGEACARAVSLHARHAPGERVRITVEDAITGLTVAVADRGPAAGPAVRDVAGDMLDTDLPDGPDSGGSAVDPDVALAVITGLVDDVDVASADGATTISMRWPLPDRRVGSTAAAAASGS